MIHFLITKYRPSKDIYADTKEWQFHLHSFISINYLSIASDTLEKYQTICLTSHRAVDWVLEQKKGWHNQQQFICLSEKQADRLRQAGCMAKAADHATVPSLISKLCELKVSGVVLVLRGDRCTIDLKHALQGLGYACDALVVYETILQSKQISKPAYDVALFYSPSGVAGFVSGDNKLDRNCLIYAIGKSTGAEVKRKLNRDVRISPVQDEDAFLQYVKDELSNSKKQHAFQRSKEVYPGWC